MESWYSRLFDFCFSFRGRIFLLLFWSIGLILGGIYGLRFMNSCEPSSDPSGFAPSMVAKAVFEQEFGDVAKNSGVFFIITSVNEFSVIRKESEWVIKNVMEKVTMSNFAAYFSNPVSYYTFANDTYMQSTVGRKYVSKDNTTMLLTLSLNLEPADAPAADYSVSFSIANLQRNIIAEMNVQVESSFLSIQCTGYELLMNDVVVDASNQISTKDIYTFPFAFAVLWYVVKSWRLMIIPFFTLGMSILISFMIMYFVSLTWSIVAFAPQIMIAIVLALSIDYSLFLLTRFKSELKKSKVTFQAVKVMLREAGKVVILSGATLALTFVSLAFFPYSFLQTTGVSCFVGIVFTILINLTFTPALLLTFPVFFSTPTSLETYFGYETDEYLNEDTDYVVVSDGRTVNQDTACNILPVYDTIWHKIARFITKTRIMPLVIVLSIFVACVPLAFMLMDFKVSMDTSQIAPPNSESWKAIVDLQSKFPAGDMNPYFILLVPRIDVTVLSTDCFRLLYSLCAELLERNLISSSNIQSIAFAEVDIPLENAIQFLNDDFQKIFPAARAYAYMFHHLTNFENTSTFVQLTPDFDPTGADANYFTHSLRDVLSVVSSNQSTYDLYLSGQGPENVDAVDLVMKYFPTVVVVTSVFIFIGVGVVFRSIYYPVRLVITIAIPLGAVYGMSWVIFGLHELHSILPVLDSIKGIYWVNPIMCFSILVGLALDYDLFLYSRIVEFRQKGFTTRASIVLGMGQTGGIITAAGIIMAIAFGGLMAGSTPAMQEIGFMLASSVLVDTFIIRTLLVPSLVILAGELNWYPGEMSPLDKNEVFILGDPSVIARWDV